MRIHPAVLLWFWDGRRAFSALLDDCPLPPGELSSSLVTALCHTPHISLEPRYPPTETEPGLLMLTTADSPGLEVTQRKYTSVKRSDGHPSKTMAAPPPLMHLYCTPSHSLCCL